MSPAEWAHIGVTALVTACAAWGAVHAELRVLMRAMDRIDRQLETQSIRITHLESRG